MRKYDYILWDFDGTVMDSCAGIIESVNYAARCFGITDADEALLKTFIGPPLRESFPRAFGFDAQTTEMAIGKYREHYGAGAMYNCSLYEGVAKTVSVFRENKIGQYIATSKPEHACRRILEKKGLSDMFDGVFGATDDGRIDSKLQVIEEAFRVLGISDKSRVVLIGDTKYDAIGAASAGIDCIGITYGAGSAAELSENGAVVFDNLYEVRGYILDSEKEYKFYGARTAFCGPVCEKYSKIKNPRMLYDMLDGIWCAKSCAPRLRGEWTKENKTLGQCSITAFLAQDIFGGRVCGIKRPGGTVHCYNEAQGCVFDLASEQFGDEELSYEDSLEQSRQEHFADADKYSRYLYLKEKVEEMIKAAEQSENVRKSFPC